MHFPSLLSRPLFLSFLFFVTSISWFSCFQAQSQVQDRQVGGPCEGCEALFEFGDRPLSNTSILPGFDTAHTKLIISGTIYQADGVTPAQDIILYFYHTNAKGLYEASGDAQGWGKRHGALRGWIKTGNDGKYQISTGMPAAYPSRSEPVHIHITVKEEGLIPYYIEDILFDDDPLLTQRRRDRLRQRGGSGVVSLVKEANVYNGKRDIYLGRNIPGYTPE
jgi:protocatechuate 3,4-dioxygenase beta subunit